MKFALHICEANISQRSYFTQPPMLKSLLRSAPDRVLDLLSDTMIGRAMLRQVVSLARKKLGFELDIQPQPGERDLWLVTAGDPGADLTLRCTVRTKTLAQFKSLSSHKNGRAMLSNKNKWVVSGISSINKKKK